MSGVALLDVNVLIALFDPDHVHHEAAHHWFADRRVAGWATCPLTENGLVRLLANPAYSPAAEPPARIVERLQAFCGSGEHVFWPDEISLRDVDRLEAGAPSSHRKVTDIYLLSLAVQRQGCLATFDRTIPLAEVRGAAAGSLALISA